MQDSNSHTFHPNFLKCPQGLPALSNSISIDGTGLPGGAGILRVEDLTQDRVRNGLSGGRCDESCKKRQAELIIIDSISKSFIIMVVVIFIYSLSTTLSLLIQYQNLSSSWSSSSISIQYQNLSSSWSSSSSYTNYR